MFYMEYLFPSSIELGQQGIKCTFSVIHRAALYIFQEACICRIYRCPPIPQAPNINPLSKVRVHMASGQRTTCHVLLAADGIKSSIHCQISLKHSAPYPHPPHQQHRLSGLHPPLHPPSAPPTIALLTTSTITPETIPACP